MPKMLAWALLVFGLTSGIAAASAQGVSSTSRTQECSWEHLKITSDPSMPAGLTLPLVDIYTYAEDHGALFGHHAKNVQHVATKVSILCRHKVDIGKIRARWWYCSSLWQAGHVLLDLATWA